MNEGVVVGVDVGSSSVRAVALDRDGTVLGASRGEYAGASAWPPGRADPEEILRAVTRALARLNADVPGTDAPAALAVGGQSPTTVPVPDGLAVTYAHPAGSTLTLHEQHGAQLEFLRDERGTDVVPAQVWDWVLHRLGAPLMQGRWPGDPALPHHGRVVPTATVVGVADGRHDVAPGTPLVPGAQDAYLAFWAAGIDVPGRALDPGGRTGGLGVAVAAAARAADMFGLRAAAAGVDIVGGPVSAHGRILEWWAAMTSRPLSELLALAAHVPPGAGGVLALPYLEGERAPRWNRELCAELVGLLPTTGPGEIARALLEATAYGLAHVAHDLAAHGVTTDVLVVGGSPARSRLWSEIKASVLGVPVEIPEFTELAAVGAALAAGAAVGWWPAPARGHAGDWPRPRVTVIEPVPHAEYLAGYERFVALGDDAERRLRESNEEDRCPTP
jgi:sugar (pentulose or hexulose) kinase